MFEKAIKAGPRVARIRFNYGTFLLGTNRLELAQSQLCRAVQLESRNAPAWANLCVALARRGQRAEAKDRFDRALLVDPNEGIAAENLTTLGREWFLEQTLNQPSATTPRWRVRRDAAESTTSFLLLHFPP